MKLRTLSQALAILLLASSGAACAASYSSLRFVPSVQDTDLRGDTGVLEGQVSVACLGIEEREGVPEVRFRMRLENPGSTPFTLVPAEFELLDAALTSFGFAAPESVPVLLEPGQTATVDLVFPARGELGLDALDLSTLTLDAKLQGGRWNWSSTFERVVPPPPHSAWSFSFGTGFVID